MIDVLSAYVPFAADEASDVGSLLEVGVDVTVDRGAPLERAIETFHRNPSLRILPVVEHDGRPAGALFETQIRSLLFNPFGHALLKNPHYGQRLDRYIQVCPIAEAEIGLSALLDFYAASGATEGLILVDGGRFLTMLPNRVLIGMAVRREKDRHARIRAASTLFNGEASRLSATLSNASEAMADQASGMVMRGQATRDRSDAMTEAATEMLAGMAGVAARGRDLVAAMDMIQRQTAHARACTTEAVDRVETDGERVRALTSQANEIGDITALIRNVADKVRMLSINASIEAARAGAAGQGFGVVAQEIKALAGQTRIAAASIAERVGSVRNGIEEVASGHDGLASAIGRVEAATTSIDSAISGQRLATHDIAAAVEQAARTGEEILADLADMNDRAGAAVRNADRIEAMAGALATDAGALGGSVSRFIAEVVA